MFSEDILHKNQSKKKIVDYLGKVISTEDGTNYYVNNYGYTHMYCGNTIPTDAFCKSENPSQAVVKAVKTKCRTAGCNDTLGGSDWIDNCNAGNEEYTCCGTNNTVITVGPTGFQDWTDIPNTSYKYALVPNPTASTDSWKFLGKTDNLTNCKLKAVEDKNTAF